jgi:nucleotide-binding universal stress UspA family protein
MVYVAPLLSPWQPWDAGLEAARREAAGQAAEDMRRKAAALAADLGVAITFLAVRGDPFTQLCRIAEEIRADAVVVGASADAATGWPARWRCGW